MDLVLAIDPGKKGALALLDAETGALVDLVDMPAVDDAPLGRAIAVLITSHSPHRVKLAVVERVQSRPGQGHMNVWTFGKGVGVIHGALGALGLPIETVPPKDWQKHAGVVVPSSVPAGKARSKAIKALSRQKASERFPDHGQMFARIKDDGRADAVNLGRYAVEELVK